MKSYRKEVMARLEEELEDRNTLAGRAIRARQRKFAPVLTGRLRLSTQHIVDGAEGVRVGTFSNIFYQGFQEFGTRHNRPHPYIKPGAIAAIPELKAIYGKEIKGTRRVSPNRLPGGLG